MKNAIILHGLDGYAGENWFPWLKGKLEEKGWQVWVPNLPDASNPSSKKWSEYILKNLPFTLNQETYIIGHSAGTVAALALLQKLPEETVIDSCILVAALKDDLAHESLKDLFDTSLNFRKIKRHAKRFTVIQSDDDPYMSVDHGRYIADKLNAELIIRHAEKHFSTSTAGDTYTKLPFLLDLINASE